MTGTDAARAASRAVCMDVKKSPPWTYRVTIPPCISITKRAMFACVSDTVFPFCSSSGRSVSRNASLSPHLLQEVQGRTFLEQLHDAIALALTKRLATG